MLLNLRKRGLIVGLLPKKGSISDQLICKELKNKLLDLSDENKEIIEYDLLESGDIKFNIKKDSSYMEDVSFSESEKHILKRGVDSVDAEEEVTPEILDICVEIREL